ncbi:hypothetical protein BJY24_007901 [Nocardia transvalensis]|uniref:Uncharacterized protein n=1 Tax=Nocardia transvalensis TaxID=37333 RepID=A0A7W9PNV5_9NOCA|nr:hypothetical protein [Nocardia transvalensis]MBB5918968.1 hypothetical protein [Nocardia transvalensis]
MCANDTPPRTEGTEPRLLDPDGAGHYHRTLTEPPTEMWVRLDALCVRDPGTPRRTNGSGLDMTGERPARVTHWIPAESGDWLGLASFSVPYADGRPAMHVRAQLVPAYALRPRRRR